MSFSRSARHRFGWEIRPSFSVSQNDDRSQVLELFRSTLGCGTIRPDRSDRTLKYETRSISDLATKVLPLFEQHPLRSSKHSKHLHPDQTDLRGSSECRSRSTRVARSDFLDA